jgi:hypothetical protein
MWLIATAYNISCNSDRVRTAFLNVRQKRALVAHLGLNGMEREDGSKEQVKKIARRALVARLGWMSQ